MKRYLCALEKLLILIAISMESDGSVWYANALI